MSVHSPASTHTHRRTRGQRLRRAVNYLAVGGCSHNIVSFLAFFCGSKSGSMFVDAEGVME